MQTESTSAEVYRPRNDSAFKRGDEKRPYLHEVEASTAIGSTTVSRPLQHP
jgi:hypothetical protein